MSVREHGVAVVTGATGGMGRVIALTLVRRGLRVISIARDPRRAEGLLAEVARLDGAGTLEVIGGDLSDRAGILSASAAIRERHDAIQILVNNAGAHHARHRLSPDGIELHIAIDYLAAYGLTSLLEPELRRGRARVVNVVSDTIRDTRQVKLPGRPRPVTLDVDQLDDVSRLNPAQDFVPFQAYARAKLLTVMAGYGFARRLADDVTVNAVHPGIVATELIDDLVPPLLRPVGGLIRRTMLTPAQGAAAALRLAVDPEFQGVTGRYFVRQTETRTPPISYREELQDRLRATTDRFFAKG